VESPFGYLAIFLCYKQKIELPPNFSVYFPEDESVSAWGQEDENLSGAKRNEHYNPKLLNYMLIHIFPISPLLSHCLLTLNGASIRTDTNNVSESWNKIVKIDEMSGRMPIRLTRFIVHQENVLRGIVLMIFLLYL